MEVCSDKSFSKGLWLSKLSSLRAFYIIVENLGKNFFQVLTRESVFDIIVKQLRKEEPVYGVQILYRHMRK